MGQTIRLTDKFVKSLAPPMAGERRIWDSEVTGLFVRVYPSGRKVYALKRPTRSSVQILTIGPHGSPWTVRTARLTAREAMQSAAPEPATRSMAAHADLTVADLIDRYLEEGPSTKPWKRASTWRIDASNLNRHVRPLLGVRAAGSVTKAEAAESITAIISGRTRADERTGPRGRARVTGGEGTARRVRSCAAAMYAWAIEGGILDQNPFSAVKLAAAPVRQTFMGRAEVRGFLDAINALVDRGELAEGFGDALRLLLLTGARKTEVLGLRWSEVDLANGMITLPRERTKAGGRTGERHIVLSDAAQTVLWNCRTRVPAGSRYVFPSSKGPRHLVGLRRPFLRVCARAGLRDFRIHDLRHTFASVAVSGGESLVVVGKLLGHANTRTTDRYAHLANASLRRAAGRIARSLST